MKNIKNYNIHYTCPLCGNSKTINIIERYLGCKSCNYVLEDDVFLDTNLEKIKSNMKLRAFNINSPVLFSGTYEECIKAIQKYRSFL